MILGTFREALCPNHFFCNHCKLYENELSSGITNKNIRRDSYGFTCTAGRTDFFFPTTEEKINYQDKEDISLSDENEKMSEEQVEIINNPRESNAMDNIQEDFFNLAEAYNGIQSMIDEQLSKLSAQLSAQYKEQLSVLKERINVFSTNVNYYRQRLREEKILDLPSMPLEDAVMEVVNRLLTSKQRYKVMTDESKGEAIAKVLFDETFVNGIALPIIISQSKKWLRANIFTPSEILKQMDLHGGSLNYER